MEKHTSIAMDAFFFGNFPAGKKILLENHFQIEQGTKFIKIQQNSTKLNKIWQGTKFDKEQNWTKLNKEQNFVTGFFIFFCLHYG